MIITNIYKSLKKMLKTISKKTIEAQIIIVNILYRKKSHILIDNITKKYNIITQ